MEKWVNDMEIKTNELQDLLLELRPSVSPVSLAKWRRICAQKDIEVFTVKEESHTIGMAILRWHELPVGMVGTVEDVIVREKYRGRGYGAKLMKEVIEFAKKRGMAYIDLTSRPERVAANKLYQKMGWKRRETNVYRLIL